MLSKTPITIIILTNNPINTFNPIFSIISNNLENMYNSPQPQSIVPRKSLMARPATPLVFSG
jgi:hypothetical protein